MIESNVKTGSPLAPAKFPRLLPRCRQRPKRDSEPLRHATTRITKEHFQPPQWSRTPSETECLGREPSQIPEMSSGVRKFAGVASRACVGALPLVEDLCRKPGLMRSSLAKLFARIKNIRVFGILRGLRRWKCLSCLWSPGISFFETQVRRMPAASTKRTVEEFWGRRRSFSRVALCQTMSDRLTERALRRGRPSCTLSHSGA